MILVLALLASGLAGCSQPANPAGFAPTAVRATKTSQSAGKIQHVVIIIQENRSFDNIFAGFPGADAPLTGLRHNGKVVTLHQATLTQRPNVDIKHDYKHSQIEYDAGKMDGFDEDVWNDGQPAKTYPYAYLSHKQVAPYWAMASQYTLADRMFPTVWGPSFTAHLDLIAGTTVVSRAPLRIVSEIDYPYNQDNPNWTCAAQPPPPSYILVDAKGTISETGGGPAPCFTQFHTMADTLDTAHVSWRYYAPALSTGSGQLWSSFAAIKNIYNGPDWTNVIAPETTVLKDIKNGKLPSVAWVVPNVNNSDHGGSGSDTGPSWVAAIVNGIGESAYWNSSAIVVLWDDWGGWYDDAPPPQLDFMGLGFRVGCILISPYAKAGTVSHTQYEYGSILKFVEQTFGAASLGYTDARATSLSDSFNFAQRPIVFKNIPAKYPPSYFLKQRSPGKVPDDDN
ncbi:MAG: alkaline phosphatase family protein [Candidatus Tumulicola sp.]